MWKVLASIINRRNAYEKWSFKMINCSIQNQAHMWTPHYFYAYDATEPEGTVCTGPFGIRVCAGQFGSRVCAGPFGDQVCAGTARLVAEGL